MTWIRSVQTRFLFLLFAGVLLSSGAAQAQMTLDMPGRGALFPDLGGRTPNAAQVYYDQSFPSPSTVGTDEVGARVRSTVAKDGADSYSVNGYVDELQVYDTLSIPAWNGHAGFNVPHSLYGVSVGGAWDRHLENGHDVNISLGVGSESDHPFAGMRETTVHFTGLYRLPVGPHGAWLFFLNYSNNRTLLNGLPLPGAMYSYVNREKRITLLAGFPILYMGYGINEKWDVRATFFLTESALLETGYKLGAERIYVRYELIKKPYLREARDDLTEQLVYQQQRVSAGLQIPMAEKLAADLNAGYEFARSFYEEERGQPTSASALLPDDWFAKINFNYRF